MSTNGKIIKNFNIDKVECDETLQSRVEMDQDTVESYARQMKEGAEFDPIIVFQDGEQYLLADGWHRLFAHRKNGEETISVKIYEGTRQEALLHSLRANAKHGLMRTNADKEKAVRTMLMHKEWRHWSNRRIARHIGLDPKTVGNWRKKLEDEGLIEPINKRIDENGKKSNVGNIGKNKKPDKPDTLGEPNTTETDAPPAATETEPNASENKLTSTETHNPSEQSGQQEEPQQTLDAGSLVEEAEQHHNSDEFNNEFGSIISHLENALESYTLQNLHSDTNEPLVETCKNFITELSRFGITALVAASPTN